MQRKIQQLLRLSGLRDDEVTFYVHLLRLKRASMTQLIAESGLNVMTAYRTIKRLQERGLVQAFDVNQKQSIYVPLSLGALIQTLGAEERTIRRLQLALKDLDRFLPFMDAYEQKDDVAESDEPIVIREGLDAFREEYLKIPDCCSEEFLHIGSMANYWRVAGMSDESPEELAFRNKRIAKGTYCRIFNTPTPEAEIFAKRDSRELRTTRLVDDIPVKNDYLAFADSHVSHFICDEARPRVIVIRQPEVVALYRRQFESMWDRGVGA